MTEDIITTFMNMLASDTDGAHVRFLKGLVVVNGIPLARNQSLVMNSIVSLHSDLVQTHITINAQTEWQVFAALEG